MGKEGGKERKEERRERGRKEERNLCISIPAIAFSFLPFWYSDQMLLSTCQELFFVLSSLINIDLILAIQLLNQHSEIV